MPEGVIVYVEYIESVPHSNPAQTGRLKKYRGIGAALLAVVAVRFVREWKEEAQRELERQAEEAEKTEEATDE